MRRLLVLTAIVGGICLLISTAGLSLARRVEPHEWMFMSQDGAFYRLSADGREMRKLADMDVQKIDVSMERDLMIATAADPDSGFSDLYQMNVVGNSFRKVLDTFAGNHFMGWIGDGDRFVFERRTWDGGVMAIDVGAMNSREIRPLLPFEAFYSRFWLWLPDHQSMIVQASIGDGYDIYRVNADLSVQNLTDHPQYDYPLTLSPDGEWLLFSRSGGEQGIYRTRLDGSKVEVLHAGAATEQFWTLSSDGEWIIFNIQRGPTNVFRMRLDGSDVEQLTDDEVEGDKYFLGLSGDAEWMVYSVDSDNGYRLYRIRMDGRDQAYLGDLSYRDQVFWSPNGEWLIYRVPEDENQLRMLHSYDFATQESVALGVRYFRMWSPDSEWLYFVEGENNLFTLGRVRRDGSGREILREISEGFHFVAWSPVIDLAWSRGLLTAIAILAILFVAILSIVPRVMVYQNTNL